MHQQEHTHHLTQLLDNADKLLNSVNRFEIDLKLQTETCKRPGLYVPCFNHLLSTGPDIPLRLSPPSSDEDSDNDRGFPTIRQVCDKILDYVALETKVIFT